VVLASRIAEELGRLAEEIHADGNRAMAVVGDATETTSVEALVKRAVNAYGKIDLAVNNAGMAGGNTQLVEVAEDQFDRVIATNLKGVFLGMKSEIPAMLVSGGAIVNLSSTLGLVGFGGTGTGIAPSIASKHGDVVLMKAAALEVGRPHFRESQTDIF
jgi:A-factor type gamma-butyrolactone 1'-reductase (1S-forming)